MNTIIIEVSGGVVTQVSVSETAEVLIVDYDCQDCQPDEVVNIPNSHGTSPAFVHRTIETPETLYEKLPRWKMIVEEVEGWENERESEEVEDEQ